MSADLLREAAALMRARTWYATSGEWLTTPDNRLIVVEDGEAWDAATFRNPDDLLHASSWGPAVALAVADWLDDTAEDWAAEGGAYPHLANNSSRQAESVARAYLGRDS